MAKVTKKKLKDYLQDTKNFNRGTEYGAGLIAKSVQRFGAGRSMLASSDGVIVAGNKSHQALAEAGIENVIEVETDGKTAVVVKRTDIKSGTKKFHELALADNATSKANLNFDETLVEEILTEEVMLEWGVGNPKAEEDDYALPPLEEIKTDIVRGDIFEITDGKLKHFLLCGDSTMKEDVEKLMNGQKADMVFTDPPYRMEATGGSNQPIGRAAAKLGENIKHLCDFDPIAFLITLPIVFGQKKMNAYIFCNKDLVPDYLKWCKESGYSFNILFWKKPNAIPLGEQHRPDVEYLLLFRKSAIWNNGIHGINYSKCLEYGRDNSLSHPTMKPVALIANEIQISSREKGIVFDFFLGSGTTMIAGHQLGRNVYGIEIMPAYCQIILDRMAKLDNSLKFTKNGKPFKITPVESADKETHKPSSKGTSLKTAAKAQAVEA